MPRRSKRTARPGGIELTESERRLLTANLPSDLKHLPKDSDETIDEFQWLLEASNEIGKLRCNANKLKNLALLAIGQSRLRGLQNLPTLLRLRLQQLVDQIDPVKCAEDINVVVSQLNNLLTTNREHKPATYRNALWMRPMTIADFQAACRRSRRSVWTFLKTIDASPCEPRRGRNVPESFGPDVNLRVLRHWLTEWETNLEHRRIFYARVIAYNQPRTSPTEFRRLDRALQSIQPVLHLETEADQRKFAAYLDKVQHLYKPIPDSALALADLPQFLRLLEEHS